MTTTEAEPPPVGIPAQHALLNKQALALHELFLAAVEKYKQSGDDTVALAHGNLAMRAQANCRQTIQAVHKLVHPEAKSVKAQATRARAKSIYYSRPSALADKISDDQWHKLMQAAPNAPRDPKLTEAYLHKCQYEHEMDEQGVENYALQGATADAIDAIEASARMAAHSLVDILKQAKETNGQMTQWKEAIAEKKADVVLEPGEYG